MIQCIYNRTRLIELSIGIRIVVQCVYIIEVVEMVPCVMRITILKILKYQSIQEICI
jgi:hypothetical protein